MTSTTRDVLAVVWGNLTRNTRRTSLMLAPLVVVNLTLVVGLLAGQLAAGGFADDLEARGGDQIVVRANDSVRGTGFSPDAVAVLQGVSGVESVGQTRILQ